MALLKGLKGGGEVMARTKQIVYIQAIYDGPKMNSWGYCKEDQVLLFRERPIYDEEFDEWKNIEKSEEYSRKDLEKLLGLSISKNPEKVLVVELSHGVVKSTNYKEFKG